MSMKRLNDQALEDYFQALFEMYGTPGWKALMEDAERMLHLHNATDDITTIEQLWFRKGELAQMSWLATHQARTEHAYADLVEEQDGEAEAPTGGVATVVEAP